MIWGPNLDMRHQSKSNDNRMITVSGQQHKASEYFSGSVSKNIRVYFSVEHAVLTESRYEISLAKYLSRLSPVNKKAIIQAFHLECK